MRRLLLGVLALVVGLGIGGVSVWYYMKSMAPPVEEEERKVLFYRHPMNPEVTSPVPAKDEMGMDYIPVYEEKEVEELPPGAVRISPEKIQKIGVRSEEVKRRALTRTIRTVGRVDPVEDLIFVINAKVPGWVEKLWVTRTDQMVSNGEKLLELFSPDLVSAQEEFLLALRAVEEVKESPYTEVKRGAEALLEAARTRLKYWDISDEQIDGLAKTRSSTRTMTIRSPSRGTVTEKMVVQGQRIEVGEPLFKVIDHSRVWVYGEVYEYEIPYIKIGQTAILSPAYSPGETYRGKIDHIYTHLGSIRFVPEEGAEARTAKVRFEIPNPGDRLKFGLFMNVELKTDVAKSAVSVPDSAVLDSGTRQVVIVDRRDGTFEPREVKVGAVSNGFYEILDGVKVGEWVVVEANFLLDSESNLRAALGSMRHPGEKGGAPSEEKSDGGGGQGGHKGHR